MGRVNVQATGVAILALMAASPTPAVADHPEDVVIQRACIASGYPENVCTCVVREASSRFTHEQLAVIGAVMPRLEWITDEARLTLEHGLTPDQLQQLRQRAEAADVVIHQACGAGLRLGGAP